jgi:hypothetical protein
MADKKTTTPLAQDPILSSTVTGNTTADPTPTFESDAFLSSPKADSNDRIASPAAATPTVIKRGGIGLLTALMMSAMATAGGAYLALFVQARPDVLKSAGLSAFLPQAPQVASLGTSATNIEPLVQRVTAIEAELLVLKSKLEGAGVAISPAPALQPGIPDQAAAAVPSPAPNSAPNVAPAEIGTLKSELAGIGGRVTAIETRLAALDPTGAGGAIVAGLQADIASLKSIVVSLQQQAAAAPSPAMTFAVVNIAEAANRSGPFLTEYETLRSALPGVPEVASLEAYARTGVPTRAQLQERFAALGPAMVAVAQAGQKEGGLVIWIRSLFSDMIKVQAAPDANGTTGDAVLLRAKTKLDQGDLSGSIEEMAAIKTPPSQVTEWIGSARKRMDLDSRISAVRGALGRAQPVVAPVSNLQAPASIAPVAPVTPVPALNSTIQGTNP